MFLMYLILIYLAVTFIEGLDYGEKFLFMVIIVDITEVMP